MQTTSPGRLALASIHRQGQYAREPVDRLLVSVMTVESRRTLTAPYTTEYRRARLFLSLRSICSICRFVEAMLVTTTKCQNAHRDDNPTSWSIHKIENGLTITCLATRIRNKTWAARISGSCTEAGVTSPSLEEARTYLLDSFHRMFPQHHCTERCESYGMAELFRVAKSGCGG
jgi:hypothetical protein